jgi:cytochrome P450
MATSGALEILYDPLSQEVRDDPFPAYARLRSQAPVYWCQPRNVWVLSTYEDVRAALRDWQTFTSARGLEIGDFVGFFGKGDFVQMDPPEHDALRRILAPRFANRAMSHYEPLVTKLTEQLLDEFPNEGDVDLAESFTQRLPLLVTCQMLGVPSEDLPWVVQGFSDMMRRPAGENGPSERALELRTTLGEYFLDQVRRRLALEADDLLGDIAHGIAMQIIDESYVPGMCLMLMDAGMETTSTLLGNIAYAVASGEVDDQDLLDEHGDLRNSAMDEFLRFDAPIQWLSRVTTADVTIRGIRIPEGSRVLLLYASANRDEAVFPDADKLVLDREGPRHLAFGEGIHFCLGMPLAKLETRVGIRALLRRFPTLREAGPPVRFPALVGRGFHHIPVHVSTSA